MISKKYSFRLVPTLLRPSVLRRLVAAFTSTILLYSPFSFAINIPANLKLSDLNEVIETLGYSTSTKFLSNPFPLGGYSGFEFGFSTEFIDSTDLARLGSGASQHSNLQFNRISFGKGIYHDMDIFIHFVPFSSSNEITEYGGQFKWTFYQATYFPFTLSTIAQANSINIQDTFFNENIGWVLLGGINLSNFSLYFGGGDQKSRSSFNKSILDPGITLTSTEYTVRGSKSHTFVGMNIDISSLFIAAQIDRYEQPVYSAKIGLRF